MTAVWFAGMSVSRSLGRAALLGLAGGLGLAALTLLGLSIARLRFDCTGLGSQECTFEQQIANDVARSQSLGALGLALVASGIGLLGRRSRS